jgi:uncharacterized protein
MHSQGKIINAKVSAGVRTEKIEEIAPYVLKVRVQTPPEKGKANKRVLQLIALHYGVSISKVSLLSGAMSREKEFLLEDA